MSDRFGSALSEHIRVQAGGSMTDKAVIRVNDATNKNIHCPIVHFLFPLSVTLSVFRSAHRHTHTSRFTVTQLTKFSRSGIHILILSRCRPCLSDRLLCVPSPLHADLSAAALSGNKRVQSARLRVPLVVYSKCVETALKPVC